MNSELVLEMSGVSSPLQISPTLSAPPSQCPSQGRKRRRAEIPNPANTLDGLVQRRVDEGKGISGRYLTENEAIESPDEPQEPQPVVLGNGNDPDVATRTCSICGYQGKWVSEMIRHKRVHTPERPFKCRYCSRTSKWKADLIRHVAKTHGIRVVSKYSRSKAFDSKKSSNNENSPATNGIFADTRRPQPSMPTPQPTPQRRILQIYSCNRCSFESEHLSLFLVHSHSIHGLPIYSCRCGLPFESLESVETHCRSGGFPPEHSIANFTIRYHREAPSVNTLSPSSSSDSSGDSGVHSDTDDSEQEASTISNHFTNGLDAMLLLSTAGSPILGGFGQLMASLTSGSTSNPPVSPITPISPISRQPSTSSLLPFSPVQQSIAQLSQLSPIPRIPPMMPLPLASPTASLLLPQFDLSTLLFALHAQTQATLQRQTPLLSPSENSAFSPAKSHKSVIQQDKESRGMVGCSLCEAVFPSHSTLSSHLSFHGSSRPHQCPNCNYAAGKRANLQRHTATHHRQFPAQLLVSLPEMGEEEEDEEDENNSEEDHQILDIEL